MTWVYCPTSQPSPAQEGSILGPNSPAASALSDTVKGTDTPKESYVQGFGGGPSMTPQSGTTLRPSTGDPTVDSWMSFLAASRVRTQAKRAKGRGSKKAPAPDSGFTSLDSSRKAGQEYSWLKTSGGFCQLTLDGVSEQFLETWPVSGSMRDGSCYLLPPLEPPTAESESGSSPGTGKGSGSARPTPNCADAYTANLKSSQQKPGSLHSVTLAQKVLWPTPRVSASHGPSQKEIQAGNPCGRLETEVACREAFPTPTVQDFKRRGPNSSQQGLSNTEHFTPNGGSLNPTWVEWLMGWPLEWTVLDSAEMESYRSSRGRRGNSSNT